MKKAAAHTTTNDVTSNAHQDADFGVTTIALDFIDTTWRIAVPVVLFAGIGIFVDIKAHTKPWMTLLGVVIGFVFAGLLLKQQLTKVSNRSADKKDASHKEDSSS